MTTKVTIEIHEALARPYSSPAIERVASEAMGVAMSIPSLLYAAVFFSVSRTEDAILQKIATDGYGENETLRNQYYGATEMRVYLNPFDDMHLEARVRFNLGDEPFGGCHYQFLVSKDGKIMCTRR